MKYKLLIYCFVISLHSVLGFDDPGQCGIVSDEISIINILSRAVILDNVAPNTELTRFSYTHDSLEVTVKDDAGLNLIEVRKEDHEIIFVTTENFAKIDELVDTTNTNIYQIMIGLSFACEPNLANTDITFTQPVQDSNNHLPTFKEESYTLTMPMPMPPKIDLSGFGIEIIAEDLDFSNTDIKFELEPSDVFTLETQVLGSKNYKAKLTVDNFKWIKETQEFTLTATDNGDPTSSSSTTLTVAVDPDFDIADPDNSDTPTFQEPTFKFDYSLDADGKPVIKPSSGENIQIVTDDGTKTEITIDFGTYNDNFEFNFDATTKELTISATETILSTTQQVLDFTITAKYSDQTAVSKSVLLISIAPQVILTDPKFTQPYYTASYEVNPDRTKPDTVTITDQIALEKTLDTATITLEDSTIFQLDGDTIIVKENLDEETLKLGADITLKLIGHVDTLTDGFSTLIITLPKITPPPRFSKSLYKAVYENNEPPALTIDGTIETDTESSKTQITVDAPYTANFAVKPLDTYSYEITIEAPLEDTILDNNREITVSLIASIDGTTVQGLGSILVQLPTKSSEVVPTFSLVYYQAQYEVVADGEDVITFKTSPISITSDEAESTDVILVESDYQDYFKPEKDTDGNWKITVLTNLDQQIIDAEKEVILTVEANLKDSLSKGHATVILDLPNQDKKAAPVFSHTYYTAEYKEDGTVQSVGDLIGVLGIQESSTEVSFEESKYSPNFALTHNGALWELSVVSPLDAEALKLNQIQLELVAKLPDSINDGSATLLVSLPVQDLTAGTFNSAFYTAKYTLTSDGNGDVSVESSITITKKPDTIVVDGAEFSNFFNIVCEDNGSCTLTAKNTLPDDILNDETEIVIAIKATRGEASPALATIIISLPLKEANSVPKFSQTAYTATYQLSDDTDKVVLNVPIKVQGIEDVTLASVSTTGDYKDNFKATPTVDSWTLEVSLDLDANIISEKSSVVVDLIASYPDGSLSGTAIVVVDLPKKVSPATISFEDGHYLADYEQKNDDTIDFHVEKDIIITGLTEGIQVSLSGDYASHFTLESSTSATVKITLNSPLSDEDLEALTAIIINIDVVKSGDNVETVSALLVIEIKKDTGDEDGNGNNGGNGSSGDDDDDKNKALIIAVAILAVLLVVWIIASGAFYFFRLRKSNKYIDLDGIPEGPRYTKNTTITEGMQVEHGTRRPTGLIKLDLDLGNNVDDNESTTDNIPPEKDFDRRKSVAFDENVEELDIQSGAVDDGEPKLFSDL